MKPKILNVEALKNLRSCRNGVHSDRRPIWLMKDEALLKLLREPPYLVKEIFVIFPKFR